VKVSIFDRGFLCADGVFDTARTVQHKPYLLSEHLRRLELSLAYVAIDCGLTVPDFEKIASELAAENTRLIPSYSDLWIRIFVTRGLVDRSTRKTKTRPTIILATEPINFSTFAETYKNGLRMVTPPFKEVPTHCVDPRLKTTSRMHYNLAELYVSCVAPGALPLILDIDGFVAQGTASNVFAVIDDELVTPPINSALTGISRTQILTIAHENNIPCRERRLSLYDLANAQEAFVTGTSYCLLPISEINGRPISSGTAGRLTQRILEKWSEKIGLNIEHQALQHLPSRTAPADLA
jgi:branched-subunit amino acid aminotransferase/4-amino-4-deoxychorismate lyase